jgi:hypothetical protein
MSDLERAHICNSHYDTKRIRAPTGHIPSQSPRVREVIEGVLGRHSAVGKSCGPPEATGRPQSLGYPRQRIGLGELCAAQRRRPRRSYTQEYAICFAQKQNCSGVSSDAREEIRTHIRFSIHSEFYCIINCYMRVVRLA